MNSLKFPSSYDISKFELYVLWSCCNLVKAQWWWMASDYHFFFFFFTSCHGFPSGEWDSIIYQFCVLLGCFQCRLECNVEIQRSGMYCQHSVEWREWWKGVGRVRMSLWGCCTYMCMLHSCPKPVKMSEVGTLYIMEAGRSHPGPHHSRQFCLMCMQGRYQERERLCLALSAPGSI